MRISKRNRKKGSALITTVLVAVLVCAMVTLMLSLSLYGQSLAKAGGVQVVLQDRLDMLTSLFLEFGVEPVEDFGYDIQVRQLDSGRSLMVVRNADDDENCVMLVERDDGKLVKRLYNVYYPYFDYTPNRTVSVRTELDINPTMRLHLDKEDYATGGPFSVYGKWKLARAAEQNGDYSEYAYISFSKETVKPPCDSVEFVHKQLVKDNTKIQWKMEKLADGTGWQLKHVSSGLYLDVAAANDGDIENDSLTLSPYDAASATQRWTFSDHWGFIWQVQNQGTGLWLVADKDTYQLTFSQTDPQHNYNYPYFSVTMFADFSGEIDFYHNTTVTDLNTIGNDSIVITPRYEMDWLEQEYPLYAVPDVEFVHEQMVKDSTTIQWNLEKAGNDWRIKHVSSGKYLDVVNANDGNAANDAMTLTAYNAASQTQVWEFIPYYTYNWQLRNKATGFWAIVDQNTYNITFSPSDPAVDYEYPYFSVTRYTDYVGEISYENNVALSDLSTVGSDTVVITPRYELNWVEQAYPLFVATDARQTAVQNRLTATTDGWMNLKNSQGQTITFGNLSEDMALVFGLHGMAGNLTVADLIITNAAGEIVYSMANDKTLYGVGDLRAVNRAVCPWDAWGVALYDNTTSWAISTLDTTKYLPNRVVGITVPQKYDQAVAKLIINPKVFFTAGETYTLTGRLRANVKGASAVAGANEPYTTIDGVGVANEYLTTDGWVSLAKADGAPITFVGGQDRDVEFCLTNAYGTLELADLKILDSHGNVVYDICTDAAFENNVTYPAHVGLGGIWKPFAWEGEPSAHPFTVNIKVNPILQTHTQADYQVPVFAESAPNS